MKKVIYDSWIAKNLLFKGYTTITLTAFVFTRYNNKDEMPQHVRNHECTHARQWVEMFLLGFFVVFVLVVFASVLCLLYLVSVGSGDTFNYDLGQRLQIRFI